LMGSFLFVWKKNALFMIDGSIYPQI